MVRLSNILLFLCIASSASAQQLLSLDSCRAMAIRNNKQLSISRLKQEVARNTRKAVRTKYLPKIDVLGGYEYTSKEISLLSDEQKSGLNNIGNKANGMIGNEVTPIISSLTQQGIITPEQASHLGNFISHFGSSMGEVLNHAGHKIVDAFETDTRNMFMASVMLKQPIYLAYWTVISLKHKQKLSHSYLDLVRKLDDDVAKMIREGVATRADGLRVNVKVNEAEMTVTQVDNGLSLAKMYLCQLCGLPLDSDITLEDESKDNIITENIQQDADVQTAISNRPELKMLENAVGISEQSTKITRAAYLPQVALTAGYTTTNPNIYNGFENKFSGVWNVGVIVRIPVWNWFESEYKVKSSKIATSIARLELNEAQEKVELQVSQSKFKIDEANRRLSMANKNIISAEENLRSANLGFKEGVMQTTDVMEAQTAWLQAQSQKIDAEIDVKLSQINLRKALGILE